MEPIHILSVGPFGRAVARNARVLRADVLETQVELSLKPETWPVARMNLLAAWRPVPDLCENLEAFSYDHLRPFVPLVLDGKLLRLGPVVVPGAGSCWTCWVRRSNQHEAWPKRRSALSQHYRANPGSGPEGFLEVIAVSAAALLLHVTEALDRGEAIAGRVWQLDLMTRRIAVGDVVGIHGCPRCGLHRPADTRSHSEMHEALAYLWQS